MELRRSTGSRYGFYWILLPCVLAAIPALVVMAAEIARVIHLYALEPNQLNAVLGSANLVVGAAMWLVVTSVTVSVSAVLARALGTWLAIALAILTSSAASAAMATVPFATVSNELAHLTPPSSHAGSPIFAPFLLIGGAVWIVTTAGLIGLRVTASIVGAEPSRRGRSN